MTGNLEVHFIIEAQHTGNNRIKTNINKKKSSKGLHTSEVLIFVP